ncbi:MAG TPA: ATP-binding protein [Drouetiella sp.]|jgi:signal transduction histidine kinase
MPELLSTVSDGFMPHGFCLQWNVPLLCVFIAGNLGIAIAYFLIPVALQRFIGKRKDLPYPFMFKLFAAFILSCGLTHLAKIWTLYHADYWLEAGLDLWTALVSLVTAALLYPLIPKALQLRSPRDLQESNDKLEKQIEETRKARGEAECARDAAIKANQLKTEFVATISHEIRTPLSGVVGLAEMLTLEPNIDEIPEMSKKLYESSQNLLVVLNALLDFSKLEAGKMELDTVEFSPQNLIDSVVDLLNANISAKGLRLEKELDSRIPKALLGDQNKARQILINFAHNAIKFTDKGTIRVEAQLVREDTTSATIRFSVTDTGIGIKAEVLEKLFQPFTQGEAGTNRKYGGTGLGLAICKKYADLMQGHIGATSEPRQGSEFWFITTFSKPN